MKIPSRDTGAEIFHNLHTITHLERSLVNARPPLFIGGDAVFKLVEVVAPFFISYSRLL